MSHNTIAVTDATFDTQVLKSNKLVLVDFWAEWCGPCRALAPKLEEISQEMSDKLTVAKVDVDSNQNSAAQYGIRSIPSLILFKNGQPVDQVMGNLPKEQLVQFIQKHL